VSKEIRSNLYEAAGEAAGIEILKGIEATLEKQGGDLEAFQLEALLTMLKNDFAPLVLQASSPKLPFIYVAMRKIVESMMNRSKQAQDEHEQSEYAYGFPASDELAEEPGAFDFSPY
jgi:hypothetical protein